MKRMLILLIMLSSFFCFNKKVFAENDNEKIYSSIILGGGIGGLTSGVYLARSGFFPLIIEGHIPGGLLTKSLQIENWPGEVKISGLELTQKLKKQALNNGCQIVQEEVVSVDFSKYPYLIVTKDINTNQVKERKCLSCIIAIGSKPKRLGLVNEDKLIGKGLSFCATCDGLLYRDRDIAIVGGGDAAIEESLFLSSICRKLYIVVRKDSFKGFDDKKKEQLKRLKNVEILYNSEVVELSEKNDLLSGIVVKSNIDKKTKNLNVEGVFLALGSTPNTKLFKDQVKLDKNNYISVKNGQKTSKEGVFAIGDITDPFYKQAISAAGDGAKAAIDLRRFLEKKQLSNLNTQVIEQEEEIEYEVVEITSSKHLLEELENTNVVVLVDFYADWCMPCKTISPVLNKCIKEVGSKVKIFKVNVDKYPALCRKFAISSMPTLLVFDKKGNYVSRKIGALEIRDLALELPKQDNIEQYIEKIR
jgi:thioredoxin reductase (NADPH)